MLAYGKKKSYSKQTGFISFLLFIDPSFTPVVFPLEYLLPSTCNSIEALVETV